MNTSIVKACQADLAAIGRIYEDIIARQEQGGPYVGWQRGVYPTEDTARAALARGDLFVQRREGKVTGAAIINQIQVDVYRQAAWQYPAPDEQVMVLHALVIDPAESGRGLGREFVGYYEAYAAEKGCPFLRIDTNAKNITARALYKKLGYREIGIVPCVFNGLTGVDLVLLEKKLPG